MNHLNAIFSREAERAKTKTNSELLESIKFWSAKEGEIAVSMYAILKAEYASRVGK